MDFCFQSVHLHSNVTDTKINDFSQRGTSKAIQAKGKIGDLKELSSSRISQGEARKKKKKKKQEKYKSPERITSQKLRQ